MAVPSLHSLCCELIGSCVINLENALDVLYFANSHNIQPLVLRTERFVRDSWKGMREKHERAAVVEVIGAEMYDALEREHAELVSGVRKIKLLGTVLQESQPAMTAQGQPAKVTASVTTSRAKLPARRFGGGGTKCSLCQKTVYPAEQVCCPFLTQTGKQRISPSLLV